MKNQPKHKAFTLLELLLSLAVFSILVSGIYGIVHAALKAEEYLYSDQERQISVSSLSELIRKNFACLPRETIFTLKVVQDGGQNIPRLAIENAPKAFAWGESQAYFGVISLEGQAAADGSLEFGIQRIGRNKDDDHNGGEWLFLTGDFQYLRWELYNNKSRQWSGEWNPDQGMPSLARLDFQRRGDAEPTQITFSFPWSENVADAAGNTQVSGF